MGYPVPALQLRGQLPFVPVASGFAFLSAAAHFTVLACFATYLKDLREARINKFRWVEYALSSSLMIGLCVGRQARGGTLGFYRHA